MVLACVSSIVICCLQPVLHDSPVFSAERERAEVTVAIERIESAILAHRYRAGLDVPVVPMAGPIHQAGYRPGDIAEGKFEQAFLPVTASMPTEPVDISVLKTRLAQKRRELDQLRQAYPLLDPNR